MYFTTEPVTAELPLPAEKSEKVFCDLCSFTSQIIMSALEKFLVAIKKEKLEKKKKMTPKKKHTRVIKLPKGSSLPQTTGGGTLKKKKGAGLIKKKMHKKNV